MTPPTKRTVFTARPFSDDEQRAFDQPEPQPGYHALAAGCPVHRGPDGTVTLVRMADVLATNLRRDVLGPGANGPMMGGQRPLIPLDLDGPEHLAFRRLLDPLFSARRMAALEGDVRRLADDLLDGFVDDGAADLAARFCQPLPSLFFLRLMGLPDADLPEFLSFKDAALGHLPPSMSMAERWTAMREAGRRLYAYFGRVLDEREARAALGEPAPVDRPLDLIEQLRTAAVDGRRLSRDQLVDTIYLLVLAGLDTVVSALACSIAHLARHPETRRRLVADRSLWPSAVEELLRFESPVATGHRTPTVDLAIAGETLPANETLLVCWASANLDPGTFRDPLTVDVARSPNPHVAFGSGFHKCLGIHLARMELRVALDQLHLRIPDYRLAPEATLSIRGKPRTVDALPLVWDRAT